MMEVYLVFQGGGSDEPLLGVYATREAAEYNHYSDDSMFIVRYTLIEGNTEFAPDH